MGVGHRYLRLIAAKRGTANIIPIVRQMGDGAESFHGSDFPTSCQNQSRNCCVDGRSSRNMAGE